MLVWKSNYDNEYTNAEKFYALVLGLRFKL